MPVSLRVSTAPSSGVCDTLDEHVPPFRTQDGSKKQRKKSETNTKCDIETFWASEAHKEWCSGFGTFDNCNAAFSEEGERQLAIVCGLTTERLVRHRPLPPYQCCA